jgi:acyl-CoA synthetase (AMP-forming)/AMP-acid ligase II
MTGSRPAPAQRWAETASIASLPAELAGLPATVPALLEQSARASDLVVVEGGRLSYGEADDRSTELAAGLLHAGVGKGSRVGILFPNGIDWVVCWLAAARIGALTVPLSTFSPEPELARAIRHSDIHTLLMGPTFAEHDLVARVGGALGIERAPLRLEATPYLRSVHVAGSQVPSWATPLPTSGDAGLVRTAQQQVTPADLLVIVSTSGATAAPKAVVHTHGSLIRHAALLARRRQLLATDRIFSPMPLFWVGGLTMILLFAMSAGACVVAQERFDPGDALDLIESERVTRVSAWPTASRALADHPTFASRDLSSIREGTLTEALPAELRPESVDLSPLYSSLGMTETGGPHTMVAGNRPLPERLRGTFGRPIPGVEHLVVDEGGAPASHDGELAVRGPFVMNGIYKKESFETFTPSGWYRTADRGWFDDEGYLHFTGRQSAMIKTNGSNVSPGEVEAVLATYPGISTALVVGVDHPERGQDVAAAVVRAADADIAADQLMAHARRELSAFKVPRHIVFLAPDEVPMLPTGKIDMATLTGRIASEVT